MSTKRAFLQPNQILLLVGLSINACTSIIGEEYLAEMFVNECVKETWYILPGDNPQPRYPYVVISMCHAEPVHQSIINHKESVVVKPIAHYSTHSFRIHFVFIRTEIQINIWQSIYERLLITSVQLDAFQEKARVYEKDYHHYDATAFKFEFLRARWNIDEISLYESNAAYARFKFGDREDHLPYSIERTMNRYRNLSDLVQQTLFYRVISGRGHNCKHDSLLTKLKSLTRDFNAYDRLFCDAFEYYNLPFTGYWNSWDMFYLRARLLRDDILSAFPPEAANAVYYASPMITFVVLQREPLTWMFIFRPFPKSLWALIIITLLALKGSQYLVSIDCIKDFEDSDDEFAITFLTLQRRCQNGIEFTTGVYRTVIVSAYSGMILLGILYPLLIWTPDTFGELNRTTNYKVCTSFDAPIKDSHLKANWKLNGIPQENWEIRTKWFPAQYFASKEQEERAGIGNVNSSSQSLNESSATNVEYFNAVLMYDDKMNLWMKGREFVKFTYSIFERLKSPKKELRVLSEIRYVSVAAGSTRLHFILDAIKRGFTCGVWMRYHYLEMNYYKNVAPLIGERLKQEKKNETMIKGGTWNSEDKEIKRPLTLDDLYSCFIIAGIGLLVSCLAGASENVFKGRDGRIIYIY